MKNFENIDHDNSVAYGPQPPQGDDAGGVEAGATMVGQGPHLKAVSI